MYIDSPKGYGTNMERILEVYDQGIWPDEIEKAKRSATVGTVFMYVDGEGRRRKTKVVDNSRTHVCLFFERTGLHMGRCCEMPSKPKGECAW